MDTDTIKNEFLIFMKKNADKIIVALLFFTALSIRFVPEIYPKFTAFDPYYHLRLAKDILTNGHFPRWEEMGGWPTGRKVIYPPFLHYLLAGTYLLLKRFIHGITVMEAGVPLPAIFGSATVVPFYYLLKENVNRVAAVFGTILLITNSDHIYRTVSGFYDVEAFVMFFMIASIYFFVKAVKENSYLFSTLSGIFLFLLGVSWRGSIFGFMLISVSFSLYTTYLYIIKEDFLSKILPILPTFILSLAGVLLYVAHIDFQFIGGTNLTIAVISLLLIIPVLLLILSKLLKLLIKPLSHKVIVRIISVIIVGAVFLLALRLFEPSMYNSLITGMGRAKATTTVQQTIGEYQSMRMTELIRKSIFGFIFVPVGILFLLRDGYKKNFFSFVALVYFLAGYYMASGAVRWSFLFMPSVAIVGSSGVGKLFERIKPRFVKDRPTETTKAMLCYGVVFVMATSLLTSSMAVVPYYTPSLDSYWEDALLWLKNNTPKDSVVAEWWDYGHWINAVAQRKNVMDGLQINYISISQGSYIEELATFFTYYNNSYFNWFIRKHDIDYIMLDDALITKYGALVHISQNTTESENGIIVFQRKKTQGNWSEYLSTDGFLILEVDNSGMFPPYVCYNPRNPFIWQRLRGTTVCGIVGNIVIPNVGAYNTTMLFPNESFKRLSGMIDIGLMGDIKASDVYLYFYPNSPYLFLFPPKTYHSLFVQLYFFYNPILKGFSPPVFINNRVRIFQLNYSYARIKNIEIEKDRYKPGEVVRGRFDIVTKNMSLENVPLRYQIVRVPSLFSTQKSLMMQRARYYRKGIKYDCPIIMLDRNETITMPKNSLKHISFNYTLPKDAPTGDYFVFVYLCIDFTKKECRYSLSDLSSGPQSYRCGRDNLCYNIKPYATPFKVKG